MDEKIITYYILYSLRLFGYIFIVLVFFLMTFGGFKKESIFIDSKNFIIYREFEFFKFFKYIEKNESQIIHDFSVKVDLIEKGDAQNKNLLLLGSKELLWFGLGKKRTNGKAGNTVNKLEQLIEMQVDVEPALTPEMQRLFNEL